MIAIASLAAGCSFSGSAAKTDGNTHLDGNGSGSGMIDAAIDAPPDGPNNDFGPSPFTVHLSSLPTTGVTLPPSINTDTSNLCSTTATWVSNTQPDACFVVGTSISSGGGITTVTGSKPIVLLATTTISMTKTIDVSSRRGTNIGPAANYNLCDVFVNTPGAGNGGGGGGGAGGTFMTQGGIGGDGDNGTANGGSAPTPGTAPTVLRGGCIGQKGGTANSGAPGNGGGAIYLVAAQSISIAANIGINASGSGASKGTHASGGSGAGAGGMIMFYAPSISATGGILIANGGGGSSGGDGNSDGRDGGDTPGAMTPAQGAIGPGGNGGNGAILTTPGAGGGGGNSNQGGGGGGGGVGYIRSNVTLTGAVASPAPDVIP